MLKLVLAVCSTLGASFGGEVPSEWVTVYQAVQDAAAQEIYWAEVHAACQATIEWNRQRWTSYIRVGNITFAYYHNPYWEWAVPNYMLSGPPAGPGPFPGYGAFPSFPPSTPGFPLPPSAYSYP
jgi:hypothetical protein